MTIRYVIGNSNVGVQVESTAAAHNFGLIVSGFAGTLRSDARIEVTTTGTGRVVHCFRGSILMLQGDTFGTLVPWSAANATAYASSSGGRIIIANGGQGTVVCQQGMELTGGSQLILSNGSSGLDCSQSLGTISASSVDMGPFFFGAPGLTVTCDAAVGLSLTENSTLTQNGTLSITNEATGANTVLVCAGGSTVNLEGGGTTVLDGSAGASGYGINARGGGRVYTVAQPSSVTGVTADLTVGTGGGEDQPDTALSASLSSLVSGDTLSSIARST